VKQEPDDPLGDRMKDYEQKEAGEKLLPLLPICARLDGRSFSNWTRGLKRPYDERLSKVMVEVTKFLVGETHAKIGYTQSDEISLVWLQESYAAKGFFDGKIQKLTSVLASLATAKFVLIAPAAIPEKADIPASFDCRVWNVPNKVEGANTILWREFDATKNSVSMAAQAHFSHKQLHKKSATEMKEMLREKGVVWEDFPAFFKRGTYVRRRAVERLLSPEELARIPEKHRPPADQKVVRSELAALDMPPFSRVTNRVEVIFDGAEPKEAEPAVA
jgi:tRNA(His) guanylyltransferase